MISIVGRSGVSGSRRSGGVSALLSYVRTEDWQVGEMAESGGRGVCCLNYRLGM